MKSKLLLTILLIINCGPLQAAERQPNFLFIYTDDQRYDALGVVQREQGERARFPWLKTPHLDQLAAGGMRFRNAFVTTPLCAPSRSAFLTGRYNHANGVIDNQTPFPTSNVTYATLLRAAGYKTAYIGKWHHGMQRGQRPGFDYSASFIGQGRYFNSQFEINGTATETSGWVDDVSTDYAVAFMNENREKPFLLVVGFKATHGPWQPPPRAAERFTGEEARPVPNLDEHAVFRGDDERLAANKITKAGMLNYFRCASAVDDNVGRLLYALDELKLTDDTVVVFSSDNGRFIGEHGLFGKHSAYEESLRVPMLVRYPKLVDKGVTSDEMVLNIDLAPTFLELAGVSVPEEMQGKSWLPLLTGKDVEWRRSFLAEYFYKHNTVDTPTLVAVRTRDAKLIKYPGQDGWTELFDLANDPYETKNLFSDPKYKNLLEKMTAELDLQIKATGYHVPAHADQPGFIDSNQQGKIQGKVQP